MGLLELPSKLLSIQSFSSWGWDLSSFSLSLQPFDVGASRLDGHGKSRVKITPVREQFDTGFLISQMAESAVRIFLRLFWLASLWVEYLLSGKLQVFQLWQLRSHQAISAKLLVEMVSAVLRA